MSERAVYTWLRIGLAIGGIILMVKPMVPIPGVGYREQSWIRAFAALLMLLAAIPYGRPPSPEATDAKPEDL